jgi:hypothetical protein
MLYLLVLVAMTVMTGATVLLNLIDQVEHNCNLISLCQGLGLNFFY